MVQTNCSKCGADLIMHDGYGVCSNCGDIVGFEIEEEKEVQTLTNESENSIQEPEIIEESAVIEEPEILEEIAEETEEIPEEKAEEKSEILETSELLDAPKKSKAPIIITIVAIICILGILAGVFVSEFYFKGTQTEAEKQAPVNDITEEIPEEIIIEEENEEVEEPLPEKQTEEKTTPAPVVREEPIKKEEAIITQAPSIAYRIRKTADDSTTQIGAFSDLDRAKAFAQSNASEGYKVFDMYGNLVYEP